MWLLKLEEKVEEAGESHRDRGAGQQQMSWPGVVSEVRIWGENVPDKNGRSSEPHTDLSTCI